MDMENGVTDRLWDKDVQEFISACRHEKLRDITLGYTVRGNGEMLLTASALYLSKRGRHVPLGYRWAESKSGTAAEIFVGKAKASAGQELDGLFGLAVRAGLWGERRHVAFALLAVTDVHSKADGVRGRLQLEYLKALYGVEPVSVGPLSSMRNDAADSQRQSRVAQAQELTLQTLNDLAYLYGARTGKDDL
jgi:hypothetical protein